MSKEANEVISVAEIEVLESGRWLHLRIPMPTGKIVFKILAFAVLAISVQLGWLDLVTIQAVLTVLAELATALVSSA